MFKDKEMEKEKRKRKETEGWTKGNKDRRQGNERVEKRKQGQEEDIGHQLLIGPNRQQPGRP